MEAADTVPLMRIEVVYSPRAGEMWQQALQLHPGASLGQALEASGFMRHHTDLDLHQLKLGIWGKLKPLQERLRDGDRIEIYRPLKVDPMEARRQRHKRDRAASR